LVDPHDSAHNGVEGWNSCNSTHVPDPEILVHISTLLAAASIASHPS
jgi:hypothetical protein